MWEGGRVKLVLLCYVEVDEVDEVDDVLEMVVLFIPLIHSQALQSQ